MPTITFTLNQLKIGTTCLLIMPLIPRFVSAKSRGQSSSTHRNIASTSRALMETHISQMLVEQDIVRDAGDGLVTLVVSQIIVLHDEH